MERITAYGNIVEIPQSYEDIWDIYEGTKELLFELLEEMKAHGKFEPVTRRRHRDGRDILRVFVEVYYE